MEADDAIVARFVDATGASADQASFFVEAAAGNFDAALNMYREQLNMNPAPRAARITNVPPRPRAPAVAYRHAHPPPIPVQIINAVVSLPFVVLQTGFRIFFRTVNLGTAVLGAVAGRVLPPPVARSLQGAVRAITQGPIEQDPTTAATNFSTAFSSTYNTNTTTDTDTDTTTTPTLNPQWQLSSWQDAAARAHGDGKFLFVYLHSAQNQDTDGYCRSTLCAAEVTTYINETFYCWGGDLRHSDAYRLSAMLNAGGYPYTALLAFSGARTRLITSIEGYVDPETLLSVLQRAVTEHGALLWQEQFEREERDSARRIREEQDAEYQRSLEADRERERIKTQQRQEAEEAERLKQEQEQALAEAAAAEQRKKDEAAAALQRRKSEKRLSLADEPSADAEGAVSLIRVRMPSGASHQRRFLSTDTLQTVYDWVDSLDAQAHLKYALATTYPRQVLNGEVKLAQSLEELGLTAQTVLLVQPEDDDDDA